MVVRKKPAGKKRRRKSIPKGVYNVPRELQCGYPLDNGDSCQASRFKLPNGEFSPRCRHHKDAVPDEMPLDRLVDLRYFTADVMKRARKGLIEPSAAQAVAALGRNLMNIMIAMEKLDPEKVAKRMVTYEEMMTRAREMTVDQARGIAEERNKALMEDMLTQRVSVEVVSDLDEQKKELKPEEKAQITKRRRKIEKFIETIEEGNPIEILGMDSKP